ncbi:Tfp pilus assembly protein PilX [Paucimonas lemoignei]|uniref:Tfp pilus assembly protein PilX n=1 Tax=Paucimonas lemoignei TaxID=29443 RepID=A0A4R3I0L9_PAULE|nr:pilus assembly PilX N-terminal domain-containing protein [Paucimonas lemoignei]TCS39078.1 Tfp pilus assembly protein PilX [Paucimonas lemoignei]
MNSTDFLHASFRSRACRMAERGFTLVSAIFLLVVLAALGAAIVTVSTTQHTASALDVLGAQAYQAARAGTEWGLYQYRSNPAAYCNNAATPDTRTFALPAGTALSGFSVTVTCTYTPFGGATIPAQPTDSITYDTATNVATVTTEAPHGLGPGYRIVMSGAGPAGFNGSYLVDSILSPTTFTYFPAVSPGGDATVQGIFTASAASLDRRQIIAVACNQPAGSGCPNASARMDYVERQVQVEF